MKPQNSLCHLPFETFILIVRHLAPLEVGRLARVSRRYQLICNNRRLRRVWIQEGKWTIDRIFSSTLNRITLAERWHQQDLALLVQHDRTLSQILQAMDGWYFIRRVLLVGRRPRLLQLVLDQHEHDMTSEVLDGLLDVSISIRNAAVFQSVLFPTACDMVIMDNWNAARINVRGCSRHPLGGPRPLQPARRIRVAWSRANPHTMLTCVRHVMCTDLDLLRSLIYSRPYCA